MSSSQAESAAAPAAEMECNIVQLVNQYPQDASDEAFVQDLKKKFQSKKLRAACTQLGLNPQADAAMNHKVGYIKLLSQYRRARERGEVFARPKAKIIRTKPQKQAPNPISPELETRTKHCGFKLVNVLFSPEFFARMTESGALPSAGLEVGSTDGRSKFWREVAAVYDGREAAFNRIAGPVGRYQDIDPRLALHHSPAKLAAIWKELTTKHNDSFSRWKQLGTHNAGFAHFCGDLDVRYLHDRLQMQPIQVDLEPVRALKRPRTEETPQPRDNTSVGADSDENLEHGNFLTPREVEAPAQPRDPSVDELQESVHRRILPNVGSTFTLRRSLDAMQDRRLSGSDEVPAPTQGQNSSLTEERMQQSINVGTEQRRVTAFDGVIYAAQAVRESMSAIDALKRGKFDRDFIAQAEERVNSIVQVWLGEMDKAVRPRTGW